MNISIDQTKTKLKSIYVGSRDNVTEILINSFANHQPVSQHFSDIRIRWPREYLWTPVYLWADQILCSLRNFVKVDVVDLPQTHHFGSCVRFQIVLGDRVENVSFDCYDKNDIDQELADQCLLYFKMQYRNEGYSRPNVLPGGYLAADRRLYLWLNKLRRLRNNQHGNFDVYGRFGINSHYDNVDMRKKAVDLLKEAKYSCFVNPMKRVSFYQFLKEIAESKICIDLPGNGYLCHRLVEYMAIGSCVISPLNPNRLIAPFEDRKNVVFCKPDLSDLIDLCEYYLQNEHERESIVQNSRIYFDDYLHRSNIVKYYIRSCLEHLKYYR